MVGCLITTISWTSSVTDTLLGPSGYKGRISVELWSKALVKTCIFTRNAALSAANRSYFITETKGNDNQAMWESCAGENINAIPDGSV